MTTIESVPRLNLGQEITEVHSPIEYSNGMFRVKTMEEIVNDPEFSRPIKKLLGHWGYEGEVIALGGHTNCGKSILAGDLAFACAAGISYWPESFHVQVREKVLIIDSEMNDRQYAQRYKGMANNPNILRATFWLTKYHGDELEEFVDYLEQIIAFPDGPRTIIVDNISTISAMVSPTMVLKLLSMLKRLKDDYGCTIIIVTHTNKTSESKGLGLNDFRGSKVFMNMADTVIGIGNTNEDPETKYIKLMKTRNGRIPDTVSLVRIVEEPYLHMEFVEEVGESDILPKGKKRGPAPSITPQRAAKIRDMKECGLSLRDMGNIMGLGKSTIKRFLDEEEAKAVVK